MKLENQDDLELFTTRNRIEKVLLELSNLKKRIALCLKHDKIKQAKHYNELITEQLLILQSLIR